MGTIELNRLIGEMNFVLVALSEPFRDEYKDFSGFVKRYHNKRLELSQLFAKEDNNSKLKQLLNTTNEICRLYETNEQNVCLIIKKAILFDNVNVLDAPNKDLIDASQKEKDFNNKAKSTFSELINPTNRNSSDHKSEFDKAIERHKEAKERYKVKRKKQAEAYNKALTDLKSELDKAIERSELDKAIERHMEAKERYKVEKRKQTEAYNKALTERLNWSPSLVKDFYETCKTIRTILKTFVQIDDKTEKSIGINPTEDVNYYFDNETVSMLFKNMCNKENKSHLDFNNKEELSKWINLEWPAIKTKSIVRDVGYEKRNSLILCLRERVKSKEIRDAWFKKMADKLGIKCVTIKTHSDNGNKTDIRKWLNGYNGDFDLFSK